MRIQRSGLEKTVKHMLIVFIGVSLAIATAPSASPQQAASKIDSSSVNALPQTSGAESPLRPVDTSSPAGTVQGFLNSMNRSYRVLMAAHEENTKVGGILTSESIRQKAEEAERHFERGVSCLDLSEIPPALRREVGYKAALQLKEILDRVGVPPADLVPDAVGIEDEAEETVMRAAPGWRVPGTDIVVARVEVGPRQGEYLFTPRTVNRLDYFYKIVKDMPYRSDVFTTDGFLEFCLTTPGWLLPSKWNQWLPAWSRRVVLSYTTWQWSATVILIGLSLLVTAAGFRVLALRPAAVSPAARYWRRALFCLVIIVALLGVQFILREQINITGYMLLAIRVVLQPIWWLLAGAMTLFVALSLAETIIASPRIDPEGIQASYYRALFSVLGFIGATAVVGVGLARVGVAVVPLLTGLGIGGVAIALAARPTLENIISSFTIFADNPYRVGDRIYIMGQIGDVESIGIRSTRVRLLSGHLTTVPNEKMATSEVENLGRRPYIRRIFNITITYDTPPEQIKRAVDILEEILAVPDGSDSTHPNAAINRPDFPPRVYFNEYNADSLNIYVGYWYHPPNYWSYMEHAHRINLEIKRRFNAEGIDFAFPTQTLHLAGDEKRPLNIGHIDIPETEAR